MTAFIGRREFITLLGGAAAWPLAARAQQPAMRWIGVLMISPDSDLLGRERAAVFEESCKTRVDGRSQSFDRLPMGCQRPGKGTFGSRTDHASDAERNLSEWRPRAHSNAGKRRAQCRSCSPVLANPVERGFVASLAQPGRQYHRFR